MKTRDQLIIEYDDTRNQFKRLIEKTQFNPSTLTNEQLEVIKIHIKLMDLSKEITDTRG